jgi:hypothetical protein
MEKPTNFQDDPWEAAYAANRAFDAVQNFGTQLREADVEPSERETARQRLTTARHDFYRFQDEFDQSAAFRHFDFLVHPEDTGRSDITFTANVTGEVDPAALEELRKRVAETMPTIFGDLLQNTAMQVSVRAPAHEALGIDSATMTKLKAPIKIATGAYASELLRDRGERSTATRVDTALRRNGLASLRDVLAYGQEATNDLRGFSSALTGYVERILAAVDPNLAWHYQPGIVTAASLYEGLHEVPACIAVDESDFHHLSVAELLAYDELSLSMITPIKASSIFEQVHNYERQFYETRRYLAENHVTEGIWMGRGF